MDIWYSIACFCNLDELIVLRKCNKEHQKLSNYFLQYKWKCDKNVNEGAKRHMERFLIPKNGPKKVFEQNVIVMIGQIRSGIEELTKALYPDNVRLAKTGDAVAIYKESKEITATLLDFDIPVEQENLILHFHSTSMIPKEILVEASTMYVFKGFYFGYHFDLAQFECICFRAPDTNKKRKHTS